MPQKKKKRVTQQTFRRRRMTALAIIILLLIIIIYSIASSCSGNDKNGRGENSEAIKTEAITTSSVSKTTPVQTGTIIDSVTDSSHTQTSDTSLADDPAIVRSIELTFYTCDLDIGDTVQPYVTMFPDTAVDLTEKWESSDESIATVDWQGNITAVSPGVCFVTVSSVSNPQVYAEVKVNVMNEEGIVPVASQTVSYNSNQNEQTVTTTVMPSTNQIRKINGLTYVQGILIANKTYSDRKSVV